ncbi:hypothetical protein SeLEV6574_g04941 [Synchytrium endobioticum]|uniref:Chalcone isomerase domain-containing protein n=1 Tax=Synchytrium endobioticum TaxID=286115 RepID=A0A507CWP2_9FUNG|nr:hypothetical protein SeLEV6574_g04941 [Synchytrium endobioticum]
MNVALKRQFLSRSSPTLAACRPSVSRRTQTSRPARHQSSWRLSPTNTCQSASIAALGIVVTIACATYAYQNSVGSSIRRSNGVYAEHHQGHHEVGDSVPNQGGKRLEPVTKREVPEFIKQHYADKPNASKNDEYCHEFYLIGLGVRTVTFLQIPVYIASFYTNMVAVTSLRSAHKAAKLKSLAAGPDAFLKNEGNIVRDILSIDGAEYCVRVEPVRNTNGAHLRNGFMKPLNVKYKDQQPSMTEAQAKEVRAALDNFNSEFPSGTVKAGQVFAFTRKVDGSLRMWFDGKELVTIPNRWLSDRFFEIYLLPEKTPSKSVRKSIAEGFQKVMSVSAV